MAAVLFLSYDGMTDPLGQSQVLPYLKGLSKEGYSIHLISFEKHDRFIKHKAHIQSICDEFGINWHPQQYTKKPPLISTLKDVRKMRKVAYELHAKYSFSIVHCRSYISALIGLKMQSKFGVKFLFDMRGFWADERVEGNIWNLKNPLFKFAYSYFKRKELQFFAKANHIVSLTHNGKDEILSWKGLKINESKITVIPCCVDLDLFDPKKIKVRDQDELRQKLSITQNDFILGYVGSIGTWYMLDEMLAYFKVVLKHNTQAKFLFLTSENSEMIRAKAMKIGIPTDSVLVTSALHKDVPLHISLFHSSIFFIRASYSKKASSPTKQGEIMAMGIPLICNAGVGDTDYIVEKYQSGQVLLELTEQSYENSVLSEKLVNQAGLYEGAEDYFSLEKGISKYLEIYSNL